MLVLKLHFDGLQFSERLFGLYAGPALAPQMMKIAGVRQAPRCRTPLASCVI